MQPHSLPSPGTLTYNYTSFGDGGQDGLTVGVSNIVLNGLITTQVQTSPANGGNNYVLHVGWNNCTNVTIKNCQFSSQGWNWRAISIDAASNVTFENNVVGPFVWPNNGSTLLAAQNGDSNIQIINNVFYAGDDAHHWSVGVDLSQTGQVACEVKNSIFWDCGTGLNGCSTMLHSNNCFYMCQNNLSGTTVGAGELLNTNPMMDSNYQLLSGSPCIDAGCLVGLPFNGQRPDIGAFESAFVGPIPNTTPLGTVKGQVTNLATGAPLAGARSGWTASTLHLPTLPVIIQCRRLQAATR